MGTPVGERIALESSPKRNVTVSAIAGYKAFQLVFRTFGETDAELRDLGSPIAAAIPIPKSKIRVPVIHTGFVACNTRTPLSCPRFYNIFLII